MMRMMIALMMTCILCGCAANPATPEQEASMLSADEAASQSSANRNGEAAASAAASTIRPITGYIH